MDHFRNFEGFAPEGRFESFHRMTPNETAALILKQYKGQEAGFGYEHATPAGIDYYERDIIVPDQDSSIDDLFKGITTDRIWIRCYDTVEPDYVIQRIKIGDQEVAEVDRVVNHPLED
jgi:hypothetical protein